METTEKPVAPTVWDWHARCRHVHQIGLERRASDKFSENEMPFTLEVFDRDGKCNHYCLIEGLSPQGRLMLRLMAVEMRLKQAPAAIFQSDTRQLDTEAFSRHFGLSSDYWSDQWNEERIRIINEHGGNFGCLSRHTWHDAIITAVKGPGIEPLSLTTSYAGNEADEVVFAETNDTATAQWYMLPDWWN